jgi:hypothetical protein
MLTHPDDDATGGIASTHGTGTPAVTIFSDLLGPEWRVVDLLVRDDKAALVEMRQGGTCQAG